MKLKTLFEISTVYLPSRFSMDEISIAVLTAVCLDLKLLNDLGSLSAIN